MCVRARVGCGVGLGGWVGVGGGLSCDMSCLTFDASSLHALTHPPTRPLSHQATCGEEDAQQADAMLINSASNLMDGALHLVRACEASSLKMLPADAVVSAEEPVEIVWRKRVNRGGGAAGNRSSVLYGGRPGSYHR
jgi:hypothetical protein